jgi:type II secretory ATPase GspE/PulE/Tfp pilus assembly ATPase PilB-like protein
LARTGGVAWDRLPKKFRAPVGCEKCRQLGYRGRTVMAEVLEVTPAISGALMRGAAVDELQAGAISQGMTPLAADGIRRAAAGRVGAPAIGRCLRDDDLHARQAANGRLHPNGRWDHGRET